MQVVKASRLYFNSQPHKEADFFRFQFLSQHSISTHSLTRRLTAIIVQHPAFPKNFNSQPHKEADIFSNASFSLFAYFNSQPHKEADVFQFPYQHQFQHFNSQPHKEADGNDNRRSNGNCNFNSQPHKEADILSVTMSDAVAISTHSLTRRLTWTVKNSLPSLQNFNSQPHKEADGLEMINRDTEKIFQLTASQGG
ncbi:Uncharacterised protein [uncultured Blautia sp.]|nr:Uncharacterised protein [uncultured Blautia sp.]